MPPEENEPTMWKTRTLKIFFIFLRIAKVICIIVGFLFICALFWYGFSEQDEKTKSDVTPATTEDRSDLTEFDLAFSHEGKEIVIKDAFTSSAPNPFANGIAMHGERFTFIDQVGDSIYLLHHIGSHGAIPVVRYDVERKTIEKVENIGSYGGKNSFYYPSLRRYVVERGNTLMAIDLNAQGVSTSTLYTLREGEVFYEYCEMACVGFMKQNGDRTLTFDIYTKISYGSAAYGANAYKERLQIDVVTGNLSQGKPAYLDVEKAVSFKNGRTEQLVYFDGSKTTILVEDLNAQLLDVFKDRFPEAGSTNVKEVRTSLISKEGNSSTLSFIVHLSVLEEKKQYWVTYDVAGDTFHILGEVTEE